MTRASRSKGLGTMAAVLAASAWPCPTAWAQDAPQDIVARWIADADALDNLAVTHGGISHDAAAKTTTVRDLKFVFDAPEMKSTDAGGLETSFASRQTVTFPEIRFDGFGVDGAYYKAASIEAGGASMDMTVEGTPEASSKTTGTYKAMRVDNPRWARLPEVAKAPDAPISRFYALAAALVDFSFDGVKIDGVEARTAGENPKMAFDIVYGPMTAGRAVHGDISELRADGFAMKVRSEVPGEDGVAKPQNFEITGGPVTASQYNYGTLVRAFDPVAPAGSPDAAYAPFIGKIEMPGIRVAGDGFSGAIGRIVMADVGVRTPTVPVLKHADAMFLASQGGKEPPEEEVVELIFGAYGAFRLGSFGFFDIKADIPGTGSFTLASYEFNDLSSKGFGGYEISGLDLKGPEGLTGRIGRVAVKDIGFPDLKALMNVEAAEKAGDIKAVMAAIPTIGSILYEGIELNMPNVAQGSLAKGFIEMGGHIGPVPTRMTLDIQNFKMPVALLEPEPRKTFEDLGYENVDYSMRFGYAWDEATQKVNVESTAELADGGRFEAKAELGGLPKFVFEDPQNGPAAAAISMNFIQGSATFTDASLVDRGFKLAAKQQGTDLATLKAQTLGALPFLLAELKRPEFMTMVSDAAKTFLDGRKTLSASAIPQAPVPLLQLFATAETDPGAIVDTLRVKVTAE